MESWSIQKPIVVVAPHLMHPARNGADILMERVARFLSQQSIFVDLVGCTTVRRYYQSELAEERRFINRMRPKWLGGLRTLLNWNHYLLERFNTPAVAQVVSHQLRSEEYGTILASYLSTMSLLPETTKEQLLLVCTHNDEFEWFETLARTTKHPLGRSAARSSLEWLRREVPRISERAVFLHVSDRDRIGYERIIPGHRNLAVTIGTDVDNTPSWPPIRETSPIVLSFVAGLGVQMASDALQHFECRFEPTLRARYGRQLLVRVVGSQPTAAVRKLCRQHGWILHADVTERELSRLLCESTFTILPFSYSTGVKLKLIRSLGSGIPFLATLASQPGNDFHVPAGCCVSDEPEKWKGAIEQWLAQDDVLNAHHVLIGLARCYSWPVVVQQLANKLTDLYSHRD